MKSSKQMKQFILLSFFFPPHPGVGVFRWSQMCKYLAREGYTIHVVTVDWKLGRKDTLLEAVEHPNIKIHRIPSGGPHNLRIKKFGNRILNGIRNKIFLHLIDKYFFYDDEAQRWGQHCIPYCLYLMDATGCDTVVATGSPFSVNYLAAKLKAMHPKMRLVQDFRDLWSTNATWQSNKDKIRRNQEMESAAVEAADINVTVTNTCKELYLARCPNTRFEVITNGYDPEVYTKRPKLTKKKSGTPHLLVHLGSIYGGRKVACDALLSYAAQHPHACRVVLAGVVPASLQMKYGKLDTITFLEPLTLDQARNLLLEADVALNFNSKRSPETAATKMYEYAATGTPILSIDYGGEPTTLLEKNAWGISVNPEHMDFDAHIAAFLANLDTFIPTDERTEQYSYIHLSRQYSELLSSLQRPFD